MPDELQHPVPPNRIKKHFVTGRTIILMGVLLLLAASWALFHRQIDHALALHSLLNSDSPREELFEQLAAQADDPVDFINRCWGTGKITHRQLVAALLRDAVNTNPPWVNRVEALLLQEARDPDASVRELALGALAAEKNPLLFRAAAAQLDDADPILRLLGMDYLRRADAQQGVPVVIRLLDDPDRRLVAVAEVALMRWSGEDYGVRAHMGIVGPMPTNLPPAEFSDAETIRRGVERRKQWWQAHSKEYEALLADRSDAAARDETRFPSMDFALKDLKGNWVRLSDFRGKVVLVNFWATWCASCLTEIGDLNALQKRLGDRVAILAIALDGVPNVEDPQNTRGADAADKVAHPGESITSKIKRTVSARGINYTVLLDPEGSVGGQYNGGELPATVIFDKEGRVRRRFNGGRSSEVLEAMVADAAR